jgi:hypothetical protein
VNFADEIYLSYSAKFFKLCKIIQHGGGGGLRLYFTFRMKSYYGFLSLLKIDCPWPGLNLRTLGPVASTITTKPLRSAGVLKMAIYIQPSASFSIALLLAGLCVRRKNTRMFALKYF